MKEKKFEKESDRKREAETLRILLEGKPLIFNQDEELSTSDAEILNEKSLDVVAICEVKTMFKDIGDTDFVRISLRKIYNCQNKSIKKGLPFLLVWRFNNGIGHIWLKNLKGSVSWGGRKNPREGSVWDRELMIYVQQSNLTLINF